VCGRGPGVAPPCVGETAACVATESLKATNFHKPKQEEIIIIITIKLLLFLLVWFPLRKGWTEACESLKATNFHKPKQIRRRNNNNHNQIIIISSSLVPTKKKGNRTFTNVKKVKKKSKG
jgi:hypothetical protein